MANYDAESGLVSSASMMVNYLYEVAPIDALAIPNNLNASDENIIYLRQNKLEIRAEIAKNTNVFNIPKGSQVINILNEK